MFCPACNGKTFLSDKLDSDLAVERCKDCGGVWLNLETYRSWRKTRPEAVDESAMLQIEEAADEESVARMCPKTGRLMARIKVTNDAPFRLDFSPAAHGVWLDKGEWEGLHALGLHRQLDAVVSERWQRELQSDAIRERINNVQRTRFGADQYDELIRIQKWLHQQPNMSEMLAFLRTKPD